ncbi:MAG: bifunctional SulP family inorganic anion transporter/carbonic anhydrase [Nocardia sp.]|nr:bifunctional SulP family inorganic anion transporter/carbonic anhydrase [Nocardia sp.]
MATDNDLGPRWKSVLRHDLPASVVVFLVALPLSIGIAVASGAPVAAGLIAAVVGGVVAGLLGGSPLQVSGPAAGLTVVVAETIAQFGWRATCFIVAAAGVLQILFGLSRIARAALAVAPVVVHAMLAGIGITIALQQLLVLLGGVSGSSSLANLSALPAQLRAARWGDVVVGLVVMAILLGWKYLPARIRLVPAPLVAILAGAGLATVLPTEIERIMLNASLFDSMTLPQVPTGDWWHVAFTVLTIALIASVESLLSAVAVGRMREGQRADFDREMLGQGSANLLSGLIGGLPITGVIVRSATNVRAGARSRASAVLHGLWILVFSVALVGVVEKIPKAALAGLLIVIGMQLVKLAHIKRALRTGDLLVYVVTVAGVVFANLLEGVVMGLALAFAVLLWRVVKVTITAAAVPGSQRWLVTIDGSCTFLALPRLAGKLAEVPAGVDVTVEMTVDFLDHAACDAIAEWADQRAFAGDSVDFVEMGTARMARADTAPPERGQSRKVIDEAIGPWRRTGGAGDAITAGIAAYHRGPAHLLRPHLHGLRDRPDADTFFLTCADARIVPNVITNSGPGDLFTVRNVGNLVPVGGSDVSVEAALIYALDKLDVRSVVVCGHSACGAMEALYRQVQAGPGLDDWLAHAQPTLAAFYGGHPVAEAAASAGFGPVDQLGMVNVARQVQTLVDYPAIRSGMAERGVAVTGLFFDLATARVIEIHADGISGFDEVRRVAAEPV